MKLSTKTKGAAVFKKVKSKFYEVNSARVSVAGIITALAAMLLLSGNAMAEDLMAAGKEIVSGTFGANSSIATWIILSEVIVGIIGYIRSKNVLILFGLAIVITFTTIGFSLVG